MKKWWDGNFEEDIEIKEPTLGWIRRNYVQDSCAHEPDAYNNCISCIMNHLIEQVEKKSVN